MSETKRIVNFMVHDGFPFDQDTFDALQTALRKIELTGWLGLNDDSGNTAYFLHGCGVSGDVADDGWIFLNGNIYPLAGGTVKAFVQIHYSNTDEVFNDGMTTTTQHKYTDAQLVFVDALIISNPAYGDGVAWDAIMTLPRLEDLLPLDEVTVVAHGDYIGTWDSESSNDVKYRGERCFARNALRRVTFDGTVLSAATEENGTNIWRMPVGWRPNEDKYFPVLYNGNWVTIKIQTDGYVVWLGPSETIAEAIYFDTVNYLAFN